MDARASEVFVGRARELGELERLLDAARGGRGAAVLVAGDAGIGKTRLASEVATRARDAGGVVLFGRCIDLVGTHLPYQPFVEALRPLGTPWPVDEQAPGSQLRVFEDTLALLAQQAASAPVLLVLEDLHWADTSSLDLVVFLAHNLDRLPLLLLATCRLDDPDSAARVRRLADGVRRSGSALVVQLAPLARADVKELLAAHGEHARAAGLADAIADRAEGNPFFAKELLAASGEHGPGLPQELRDVLLQRFARLDQPTQDVLRLAAAAGREVDYPLLCAAVEFPERALRDSLRAAVEGGVLVADAEAGRFRFRHALLAEAVYATILPGEREELHGRLAEELARGGTAGAAELAPHWAAAGRKAEALAASVEAARRAEEIFGLAEALAHLDRALALWDAVPGASEHTGFDLAHLCAWAGQLAGQVGQAARAVELTRRAIELVGPDDPSRAARLHVRLGEYLVETGSNEAGLAALERAVELVPAEPPSAELAYSLGSLAGGLMVAWRHAESLPVCERALAIARLVGAGAAEVRALTVLGLDLAYLGRGEEGIAGLRQAVRLAEELGDRIDLEPAYVCLTDGLTMLGRPRESARVAEAGLEVVRGYGGDSTLLVANRIEALLAIGEWDEADRSSAAALRRIGSSFPHWLLILRAASELGRGELNAARVHLEAASATIPEDRVVGLYDAYLADLALWERRWTEADEAVQAGLARARQREAAQVRVQLCARGLRAHAELTALARARRDADAVRRWLARAEELVAIARRAASEAAAVTPNAAGWSALAEAEYARAGGRAEPETWSEAAATWERLERPPLAAYCRWREAETLVAAGASRADAGAPLRRAYGVAARIGARPLLRELELLAQRARLEPVAPEQEGPDRAAGLEQTLGLTPREVDVLTLVARGYTNREIAAELVISVKTAGVHVSHILHKLDAPNRREAAAIAHRVTEPRAPVAPRAAG